jgi:hypothetical protein
MARRPIAFNNSTKTANSIKKNKVEVGVASDNYASSPGGLTWFNGADSTSQYVIYSDTFSLGMTTLANAKPVCWASGDLTDVNVLRTINGLPTRYNQAPFTTIASALEFITASSIYNMVSGTLDNIVTDGLVFNLDGSQKGSYPGSGSSWYDLAGGVTSTLTNGAVYSASDSGIMSSDGVNDYVDSGYDLSWNNTNSVSVDFWMRPSTISGGNYGIIGKEYPSWEWAFYQDNSNLNLVYWNTAGGHTNDMDFGVNAFPTANIWYHIVYTWNGSVSSFYINGTLAGSKTSVNPTINQNRSNNVMIGGHTYVWGDYYWNGKIGAVRFYNKALSGSEITQNFNASKTKYGL